MNTTTATEPKQITHSIRGKGRELKSHTCWSFVYEGRSHTCHRSKADALATIETYAQNAARWARISEEN
jgi:hypothetical protein